MLKLHAEESIVLSAPERLALREALADRRQPPSTPPPNPGRSLLTGVMRCAVCGDPVTRRSGGRGRRDTYECSQSRGEPTALHGRVMADEADALVTETLLADWSEYRPAVRIIPAEEYDVQVAEATEAVEALRADLATADRRTRPTILATLDDAEEALETLLASPPARVAIMQPGERTIGELWELGNTLDRREILRDTLRAIRCLPARDENGKILPTADRLTIARIDDADPELA